MNSLILNRDFQHPTDGWYQIEPKGHHPNHAADIVQVIDDAATEAIVNRFNADADQPDFAGMLIDHEHFKHDEDKETRAYGWLMKLENRADGIYGQIRWSQTGKAAVDGGDYRFFSTEYAPADLKVLNSDVVGQASRLSPRRVRPLRLDGLTLTNEPNNKGGKPITNRNNNQTKPNTMKSLCTLLGLPADAAEEAIADEVSQLINRAQTAEAAATPLKNRVKALETENSALLDEQIAAELDGKGIRDEKVRNKLAPVLKSLKNRQERLGFIADVVGKPVTPNGNTQRKIYNRQGRAPEGGDASLAHEAGRVQKAESEIQEYRIKNRCSYAEARQQVRRLKPELFGTEITAAE